MHLAVDSHGMPVRFLVTEGTAADCRFAAALTEGLDADFLLADRGYDTGGALAAAAAIGAEPVIPPKSNRLVKRDYDRHIYKQRHLVENAFMHLKRWRGIATRYAKRLDSFVAAVQVRCISLWLHIL